MYYVFENWLNYLAQLCIEFELVSKIEFKKIIDEFVRKVEIHV